MKRKHPGHVDQLHGKSRTTRSGRRIKGDSPSISSQDSQHEALLDPLGNEDELNRQAGNWRVNNRHELDDPQENTNVAAGQADFQPDFHSSTQQTSTHGSTYTDSGSHPSSDLTSSSLWPSAALGPHTDTNAQAQSTIPDVTFENGLLNFNFDQWSPDMTLLKDSTQVNDEWLPSDTQISQGCELFFTHASSFLPFLHQPTFNADNISKMLLLSILCVAYQHGEDPDCDDQANSGSVLSMRSFHRARALIAAEEENPDDPVHGLTMVQSYLLLQIFAMMYSVENDSAYGLKLHSKMISLARAASLAQPTYMPATETTDLNSLWHCFVQVESRKRTLFAVHQLDTLWYQFLSIPRSLSHLEIKHDLPCPSELWTAPSSETWAHRQLVTRQFGPTVPYSEAVRRLLSDTDLSSVPAFDPYGTINITQFLISSAREISGWSTMSGIISMERYEPIRASLHALSSYVRPQSQATSTAHAALCEATWEMAMIEMQMWSPSHTGGIVANSVDTALEQLTHFAPSCEFLREANLVKSTQPHVDWFLRYLDAPLVPDSEAPWLMLYAYKAFMVAWQLVKGGMPGSMSVVGVYDGDTERALAWARTVFRRRDRWKLGKIIMACLDKLEEQG